jgi:transcriptional regulator with XRE-family HTH domain
MGLRANPTYRQRRLGAELRRLRETSGLSAAEAGAFADLRAAHMSHIETGRTAIPEAKLRALTTAYGCVNEPLIDALVALGQTTGKGWWSAYRDTQTASALDLAELEAAAVVHRSFQWIHVPGLLQTAEYMRSLFEAAEPGADRTQLDKGVEFRLGRQQILHGESPPLFHAVIHEAALHMQFVGAEIMRRQIEHLVELAQLPHVRIQVLPFATQAYPVRFGSPFVIFGAPVPELGTVYVEHPVSSPFLADQPHRDQFTEAFEALSTVALPPLDPQPESKFYAKKDSLGLVQHLLYVL